MDTLSMDTLTCFCIIILVLFIWYVIFQLFLGKKREGLENNSDGDNKLADGKGIAGDAANYAALIKAKSVQIQDTLLISKYRSDYENVIINLEDLCNFMMLTQALSIDVNSDAKSNLEKFTIINGLSNAKKSLNECMQFIDKQQ